mmetsp:Transcript_12474/g.18726  ORF Transcript_12474/g.18726 Transcript_12474/m.18726 type:complete len:539 (+) Transcript_12474:3-1619(+)
MEGGMEMTSGIDVLKNKINEMSNEAGLLFREKEFQKAADKYSEAILMCKNIPELIPQKHILLNNRSAMREKASDHENCLADCDELLEMDPKHKLTRIRKARVLEEQGYFNEALVELYVYISFQIMDMKKDFEAGRQPKEPEQPARMEELIKKIANELTDRYLEKQISTPPSDLPSKVIIDKTLSMFESYSMLSINHTDINFKELDKNVLEAKTSYEKSKAFFERGLAYAATKKFDSASLDIETAYSEISDEDLDYPLEYRVQLYNWHATFVLLRSMFDEAAEIFSKALKLDPFNCEVLLKMGCLYIDKGEIEKAKDFISKAMDVNVKLPSIYFYRSQIHAFENDQENMLTDLQTCMDLDPTNQQAVLSIATLLIGQGDIDQAESVIENGLAKEPNNIDLLLMKGELMVSKGVTLQSEEHFNEGIFCFDRAIQIDPSNAGCYANKGTIYIQALGKIDEGKELIEKALELDPNYMMALTSLAQVYMNTGNHEDFMKAQVLFEKALNGTRNRDDIFHINSLKAEAIARMEAENRIRQIKIF